MVESKTGDIKAKSGKASGKTGPVCNRPRRSRKTTQSEMPCPLFNGKERDEETGLYYYGARYYDPEGTNWYGVDPLWTEHPDISPYVYCAGNPIKYIDPDGMDWWTTDDPAEAKRLLDMQEKKSFSGGSTESFNYESWDRVTDEELQANGSNGKLTYNDETRKFYTSYGEVENGEVVIHGVQIQAEDRPIEIDGFATASTKHQIIDPPGLENVYTFERILFPVINLLANPEKIFDRLGFAKGKKTKSSAEADYGKPAAEHTKNMNKRNKHEKGRTRVQTDRGGEKGDVKRTRYK